MRKNQIYNKKFTLFLDRDGVINERLPGAYVQYWSQFHFLPGVLKTITACSEIFGRIIIITNQQGVGKGLMTAKELEVVHAQMLAEIQNAGGNVSAIYFCPHLRSDANNCRKPNVEMGIRAQEDFPDIDFAKSIMIGDSTSDILFGKKLGMETVFITSNPDEVKQIIQRKETLPNHSFHSLLEWYSKRLAK